ncbi:S8 family peptidase [Bradyrhizobium sp.]|uniref:S8 family peptidase n=1 Tax=Bradyrhizobium sp. TaxID=376 RepID=UPI0040379F5D
MSERKSVIITFKPKDQRRDRQTDKLEIVRRALTKGTRAHFLDAATLAKGARPSIEDQVIGYDVNRYEAPIVTAQLTRREIQLLRENDNVATVEDDVICHATGFGPFPHRRMKKKEERPVTETIPANVKQVNAEAAWPTSKGKGIGVAILDTGIDFDHPDLKYNYADGVSFVPDTTPMDDHGHGTHCAGIIAAARNGSGVVGVAPEASLYAVKVLDKEASGLFSWSIAGIDWCMNQPGINIINMSLGAESTPTALKMICDRAWSQGLLIVAGAGNQDGNPVPPQQSNVDYPARYRDVVAVSSIDSHDVIAPNSARGCEVDLCAPGVDIWSTLPGGTWGPGGGTSVACPHVAGVAALAWGAHLSPRANNEQIWGLLASTAVDLGRTGRDSSYGYGRVNAGAAVSASFPPAVMPRGCCC